MTHETRVLNMDAFYMKKILFTVLVSILLLPGYES